MQYLYQTMTTLSIAHCKLKGDMLSIHQSQHWISAAMLSVMTVCTNSPSLCVLIRYGVDEKSMWDILWRKFNSCTFQWFNASRVKYYITMFSYHINSHSILDLSMSANRRQQHHATWSAGLCSSTSSQQHINWLSTPHQRHRSLLQIG